LLGSYYLITTLQHIVERKNLLQFVLVQLNDFFGNLLSDLPVVGTGEVRPDDRAVKFWEDLTQIFQGWRDVVWTGWRLVLHLDRVNDRLSQLRQVGPPLYLMREYEASEQIILECLKGVKAHIEKFLGGNRAFIGVGIRRHKNIQLIL
jgi:hypothetical protein